MLDFYIFVLITLYLNHLTITWISTNIFMFLSQSLINNDINISKKNTKRKLERYQVPLFIYLHVFVPPATTTKIPLKSIAKKYRWAQGAVFLVRKNIYVLFFYIFVSVLFFICYNDKHNINTHTHTIITPKEQKRFLF